jgi:hypothetical protein
MNRLRDIALILSAAVLFSAAARADDALNTLKPFLRKHCLECHGPDKQKNEIRFDTLGTDLTDRRTLEIWQDVLDQLNLGEMPPKKAAQPARADTARFIDALSARLRLAYAQRKSTGGRTVIRRLNRLELRNTLRDLLFLQGAAYRPGAVSGLVDNSGNGRVERKGNDPVRLFPEDELDEGFSNIGDRLVMSDFLLKLTLGAAEETLAAATHTGPRPNVEPRVFAAPFAQGRQLGQRAIETIAREEFHKDFDLLTQRYYEGSGGRLVPRELGGGVRTSARYRVTVEVSGHNQKHPWNELATTDQTTPFQIGLHLADARNGGISGPTSHAVQVWQLPGDGKRRTFSAEMWIDDTWTPWIGWENGPYDRNFRAERLVEKYYPAQFTPRPDRKKVPKEEFNRWLLNMARVVLKAGYAGPHVRIHSLKLEPLIDQWPPRSHTALYGKGPVEQADVGKLLQTFATRAYRRPIAAAEVAPYVKLVRSLMEDPKAKPLGAISDLKYRVYHGKWTRLPDFDKLKPTATGALAGGLIDLRPARLPEHYGMVFEGRIEAPMAGEYEFEIASDDGSRIIVGGQKAVEHDGLHGASTKRGKVKLAKGIHPIRVEYFAYGRPNSLRVEWSGPGIASAPLSVTQAAPRQLAANPEGTRAIRALQAGYTALLCSPRFLYLRENPGELDTYALASRLSYFLWSSMPDETLFRLAAKNKLRDPAVMHAQVERMLNDPKAQAFVQNFTTTWLRLDKLGKMPPEKGGPFRFYHDRKMEPMLTKQATAFFADVLKRNDRLTTFIHSDHTFLNASIAQWMYGRFDVPGERMIKVPTRDPRRGGILTMPAVMTATANGVDTSPIVRGVWLLENILGTPPSPPPPDVEPLSPDLRGAKTIREQLERHRKNEACASCHRKIDPMGFALENFDPVGRWRTNYRTNGRPKIDPTTELPNGDKLPDIVAFKQMLLTREPDLARCLTEKMLTYATGRRLEPIDRGEIDRLTKQLAQNGNRLRDLVHLVATSRNFLSK